MRYQDNPICKTNRICNLNILGFFTVEFRFQLLSMGFIDLKSNKARLLQQIG